MGWGHLPHYPIDCKSLSSRLRCRQKQKAAVFLANKKYGLFIIVLLYRNDISYYADGLVMVELLMSTGFSVIDPNVLEQFCIPCHAVA